MLPAELSAIFACVAQPFSADCAGTRFIQLHLYAHRADDLQPGVYRFWPPYSQIERLRVATNVLLPLSVSDKIWRATPA